MNRLSSFIRRVFRKDAELKEQTKGTRLARTHDYSHRYWGHDFSFLEVDGNKLTLIGWGPGLEEGDFILIPNRDAISRYKLTTVRYETDPPDMWTAKAIFAPTPKENNE